MPHRLVQGRSVRSASLAANAFELFVCLLAVLSCLTFLLDPDSYSATAIGAYNHPFDYAWNVMYGIGAMLVSVGLFKMKPQIEVAGLCLFTSAVAINFFVTFSAYGNRAFTIIPTYIGFCLASLVRGHYLIRVNRRPE